MSHSSVSAYPPPPMVVPRAGLSIWTPGLRLLQRLELGAKLWLLLLGTWLPLLLALLLWNQSLQLPALTPLSALLDGQFGMRLGARWAPLGLVLVAALASLYLTVCLHLSLSEQALQAQAAADERLERLRDNARRQADELARSHAALLLDNTEVRAAIGEIARRTVALCGMLDADTQDAARASADLDAIQDEERHALQLMAALRARLLSLAHHCQALGEAAGPTAVSQLGVFDGSAVELGQTVSVEISQCHQLSERVGGAERLNERRIQSMRLGTDRLVCRAERGMLEGQQLMVLTRQIQASQAATQAQLEQLAAACAALAVLGETAPG